ncbi:uncharacterized protein EDB91DRAFT_207454 [Suillus paluster]|uniref:uncharacterized protein n=1 Tax=Suillus paluster TaxID=48578 RepID=UPI001B8857D2|nr:uncharacterized protein EDB91DRAFT_207454 [Suillus paluster]KAG1744017.1 hypothetical protein EDB91DRAFT_207454 [Suillus paluster]
MTLVSDDLSWWPSIKSYNISSYFAVAASAGVMYDWALTFGQEVELVWRQRWSLMTALYLGMRYLGIIYAVMLVQVGVPTIPVTDAVCYINYIALDWMSVVVNAILGVIITTRLHAMSQNSRKMLILLVVVFLAVSTFNGVVAIFFTRNTLAEAFILSGTYQCTIAYKGNALLLDSLAWILTTVWEVLALYLAAWIAVKHFRELRQQSAGGIIGDCFTVLMRTHMFYFASFVVVSCSNLAYIFSPISADTYSLKNQLYNGLLQIFMLVQMFVLGPHLILSVREYHAKVMADSDSGAGIAIISIALQERAHMSTSLSM